MSINNKRSYTEYTVTQPTTDFAIGFNDFDEGSKDIILVTLNGVLVETIGYAAMRKNESTVTITPAITEGTVRLTRETDIDEPFHKFTAGALFSAKSMDENFQQVRHSQQEVRDGFVFLEYNTNGIVQESKEATAQAKAATVEATYSAVRAETAADTAVQAVGSLQGVVNAATTATTNANAATATATTAASQATATTTSAQNAAQAANTAKQEATTAAANANAATVDTLAATGRANEAADVVADLVVGKVRAQDVSTSDGSTQAVKNTEFRNELDALPFEDGVLADTFLTVTPTLDTIARTQRAKNAETRSVLDYGAIGDGVMHRVQELYTAGTTIYNPKYTDLNSVKADYPLAINASDSIDNIAFQHAINSNYGKRLWIPYARYMLTGLVFEKAINFVGELRGMTATYAADASALDFAYASADTYAITIKNPSGGLVGLTFDGLYLFGTPTSNGITIGNSLQSDVADLAMRNIVLYGFKDGLTTTYMYGATFDSMRIQSCTNGIKSGNQSNQIIYLRCAIVTISGKALEFSNSEGIVFTSCNISNLSSTTDIPIRVFQSSVTFNECYFENIDNTSLMVIGGSNEAPTAASTVMINSPLKMEDRLIVVAGDKAYVEITGNTRGKAQIVGVGVATPHKGSIVSGNNMVSDLNRYLFRYKGSAGYKFVSSVEGVITYTTYRNYTRIKNASPKYSGFVLADSLVIGEVYTLSYAISNGNSSYSSRSIDMKGSTSAFLVVSGFGEMPLMRHISFVATDAMCQLFFQGELDVYAISMQKGNRNSVDVDLESLDNSKMPIEAYSDIKPTTGGWAKGDRVHNTNPVIGTDIGWVCTASPSTFASLGKIEAMVD